MSRAEQGGGCSSPWEETAGTKCLGKVAPQPAFCLSCEPLTLLQDPQERPRSLLGWEESPRTFSAQEVTSQS